MTVDIMKWNDDNSPEELRQALEEGDFELAEELVDTLIEDLDSSGRLMDATAAKLVLKHLRSYARFGKFNRVASKLEDLAHEDPQVLRQLAQSRIELGQITKAIGGLLELKDKIDAELEDEDLDPNDEEFYEDELSETIGLLGRAYKQIYINANPSQIEPRTHDLEKSLEYHREAYNRRIGDYLWHGVNIVALLTRKKRVATGRSNAYSKEAQEIAESVLKGVKNLELKGPLQPWSIVNRIECNLALGKMKEAREATEAYLEVADKFSIQSTRRQLIEIWMLDEETPPGNEILFRVNSKFAELGGGVDDVVLDLNQVSKYEKVWDDTKYQPIKWMYDGLLRAKSVARLGPSKYKGSGTGFLFDGSWIGEEWAGKPLLLTNAHVCSNNPDVLRRIPYKPKRLVATFFDPDNRSDLFVSKVSELVWTSSPRELDATLLLLEKIPDGCTPPPLCTVVPPVTLENDKRLNILGHPQGLDLQISLQDNKIVDVDEKCVYYKTPTAKGSSGSPVFNQAWELVALHHAMSKEKKANKGIRIDLIIEAIKSDLAAS